MHHLLTIKEVVRLIEATQGTTKAMLLLMYLYGLRSREVIGLQIENVDFKRLVFTIKGKNRSEKTFPIIPTIEELLKKIIGGRKQGFVFTSKDGGPVRDLKTRLSITRRRA